MTPETLRKELISYPETNSFTPIALDLHARKQELKPFVNRFFTLENISEQIQEKSTSSVDRKTLYSALVKQYEGIKLSTSSKANLEALLDTNTFTVTTGHQLGLFTGPLYFIYKIAHTIKLAQKATELNPGKKIVPVFWMATEDHDFAEIATTRINGAKLQWNKDGESRPVGRLMADELEEVFKTLEHNLGEGPQSAEILRFLRKCYSPEKTLAEASRLVVNELFGKYGLLIIDGDDAALKALFAPIVERELKESVSFKAVSKTVEKLSEAYKIQVNPRECNLFLIEDGIRRRIDKMGDHFQLAETEIVFTDVELLKRLNEKPADFSPNVILRPVYQELILPNLAYVGGGGEQAYWLELKGLFADLKLSFPMLVLRNSVQFVENSEQQLMDKLGLDSKAIFQSEENLYKHLIADLESDQFYQLNKEFLQLNIDIAHLAEKTEKKDPTLKAHIEAEGKRRERFLKNLEKKLYRVAKVKHESTLRQLDKLREGLFPGGGLQERKDSIFTFIYRHGFGIVDSIVEELDAANEEFTVLYL